MYINIDPPYNTGKDFIYKDDFYKNTNEYLDESMQVDSYGNKYFQNTESNGRFHSDWLSMIYPRLKLAKNLLAEDGLIFISIDDNEENNLKTICNEIFGKKNCLSTLIWRTDGNFDNQAKIKNCHESILVYAKNINLVPPPPVIDPNIPKSSKLYNDVIKNTIVKNGPKNPVSSILIPKGFPVNIEFGVIKNEQSEWPQYSDNIIVENYKVTNQVIASSGWASKDLIQAYIKNEFNSVYDSKGQECNFVLTKNGTIEVIKKRSDEQSHVISVLTNFSSTQKSGGFLKQIDIPFSFPKPIELIKYLIKMNKGNDFIVLDFFSGSSTTAHAVIDLNSEDKGKRKYIMVQVPEKVENSKYKTICDIGKSRINIISNQIKQETNADIDYGFRVYKVDSTNMKDTYYNIEEISQTNLFETASNIKEDRTPEDLLTQVILDLGLELSLKIEEKNINGKKVFYVDEDSLIACFDEGVDKDLATVIAKDMPMKVVFRDSCFINDSEKENIKEIFKKYSPDTDIKVL